MIDPEKLAQFNEANAVTLEIDPAELRPDGDLKNDYYISSIQRMMIIADIGEIFGVELEYEQIRNCVTYGDLLSLVDAAVNQ